MSSSPPGPDEPDGKARPRSRSRSKTPSWQRRWPVAAVGLGLVATLTFAWLAFAGVHHGTRSVLHAALAVSVLAVVALPDRSLRNAGVVVPLAAASGLILAGCAAGLVPAPHWLRAVVAPGTVAARPDFSWWTLSLDPEATVGEGTDLLLPIGALLVAAAWGATWWRRSVIENGMRIAFLVVVGFAAVHAATAKPLLLGLVPSSLEPGRRFFAPFIDPNHLGSAIALLLPAVLAGAADPARLRSARAFWAGAAVAGVGMLFWIASSGAMLAGGVVILLTAWRLGDRARIVRALPVLFAAAALAAGWTLVVDPQSGTTFGDRVSTWVRGFRTLPSFWLAGTGGGTFSIAQQPLNTRFVAWGHAHSDYVEWVVEFGVVGLLLVAPIARRLWPREPVEGWRPRADLLLIGIAGVLVHAAVDFPLQIPALAMAVAAVFGLRRGAFESRIQVGPGRVRAVLIPFVALEIGASLWELRTARVERAVDAIRAGATAGPAVETLQRWAPWRPEIGLADAVRQEVPEVAVQRAALVVAAHPEDPRALRVAGMVLARNGAVDQADAAFTRAIDRYPGDWRTWVARAEAMSGDRAVAAWKDAFVHGAPAGFMEEAWPTLPLGVVWVDVGASREARFSADLARFLARRGELDSAALAYEQVWMLDPHAPPDPIYPKVLLAAGRVDDATRVMEAFLPVSGGDWRFLDIEAQVLEARGEWAEASAVWTQLAKSRPSALSPAMKAIREDKGAAAAVAFVKQWELSHTLDPSAHLTLAELYLELDQRPRCAMEIKTSDLLTDERLKGRATHLLQVCDIDTR